MVPALCNFISYQKIDQKYLKTSFTVKINNQSVFSKLIVYN